MRSHQCAVVLCLEQDARVVAGNIGLRSRAQKTEVDPSGHLEVDS
jgi:hypothetical protein